MTELIVLENRKKALVFAFSDHLKTAQDALVEATTVVVQDINDRDGMQAARERRLRIAKLRTAFDKFKQAYKKPVLEESKAIDAEFNRINKMFKQAEADLLYKEETYSRYVEQQRIAAMSAIITEIPETPKNLGKMSNAEFSEFSKVAEFYNELTKINIPDVEHPIVSEFRDLLLRHSAQQRV